MIANSCERMTFFASFFLSMCWYKIQSLVFLQETSDNFNSLLWGYYSFGLWILLTLKLTVRIKGMGRMAGIKLERGGGSKNFEELIMWSMYLKIWKIFLA